MKIMFFCGAPQDTIPQNSVFRIGNEPTHHAQTITSTDELNTFGSINKLFGGVGIVWLVLNGMKYKSMVDILPLDFCVSVAHYEIQTNRR